MPFCCLTTSPICPGQDGFRGTEDEIRALRPPPMTRVFKLRFLRPAEAARALRAVLAADAVIVKAARRPAVQTEDKPGAERQGAVAASSPPPWVRRRSTTSSSPITPIACVRPRSSSPSWTNGRTGAH